MIYELPTLRSHFTFHLFMLNPRNYRNQRLKTTPHYATRRHTTRCHITPHHATHTTSRSTTPHHATHTTSHHTTSHHTLSHYTTPRHTTPHTLHHTTRRHTTPHHATQRNTHHTTPHHTTPHALHYVTMHEYGHPCYELCYSYQSCDPFVIKTASNCSRNSIGHEKDICSHDL